MSDQARLKFVPANHQGKEDDERYSKELRKSILEATKENLKEQFTPFSGTEVERLSCEGEYAGRILRHECDGMPFYRITLSGAHIYHHNNNGKTNILFGSLEEAMNAASKLNTDED